MYDQRASEEIAKLSARVAKLEREVEFLLGQSNIAYVDHVENDYSALIQLKRQGNIIGAIKLYREKTGASLVDAKNFVDKL